MSEPKDGAEFVWQLHSMLRRHEKELAELLMGGWEPFAVAGDTVSDGLFDRIYLRRLHQKKPLAARTQEEK